MSFTIFLNYFLKSAKVCEFINRSLSMSQQKRPPKSLEGLLYLTQLTADCRKLK